MQILNTTRGILIAENAHDARGTLAKAAGLIGAREPHAIFFRTRWGVHTAGMRFPIDVAVLDDLGTVRALRENLKPFRAFFWNPRYRNVLELSAGTIARTRTTLGDTLDVRD